MRLFHKGKCNLLKTSALRSYSLSFFFHFFVRIGKLLHGQEFTVVITPYLMKCLIIKTGIPNTKE